MPCRSSHVRSSHGGGSPTINKAPSPNAPCFCKGGRSSNVIRAEAMLAHSMRAGAEGGIGKITLRYDEWHFPKITGDLCSKTTYDIRCRGHRHAAQALDLSCAGAHGPRAVASPVIARQTRNQIECERGPSWVFVRGRGAPIDSTEVCYEGRETYNITGRVVSPIGLLLLSYRASWRAYLTSDRPHRPVFLLLLKLLGPIDRVLSTPPPFLYLNFVLFVGSSTFFLFVKSPPKMTHSRRYADYPRAQEATFISYKVEEDKNPAMRGLPLAIGAAM